MITDECIFCNYERVASKRLKRSVGVVNYTVRSFVDGLCRHRIYINGGFSELAEWSKMWNICSFVRATDSARHSTANYRTN